MSQVQGNRHCVDVTVATVVAPHHPMASPSGDDRTHRHRGRSIGKTDGIEGTRGPAQLDPTESAGMG